MSCVRKTKDQNNLETGCDLSSVGLLLWLLFFHVTWQKCDTSRLWSCIFFTILIGDIFHWSLQFRNLWCCESVLAARMYCKLSHSTQFYYTDFWTYSSSLIYYLKFWSFGTGAVVVMFFFFCEIYLQYLWFNQLAGSFLGLKIWRVVLSLMNCFLSKCYCHFDMYNQRNWKRESFSSHHFVVIHGGELLYHWIVFVWAIFCAYNQATNYIVAQ